MKHSFKVGDYILASVNKSNGEFWFRTSKAQRIIEIKDNQLKMECGWCVHYGKDYILSAKEGEKWD